MKKDEDELRKGIMCSLMVGDIVRLNSGSPDMTVVSSAMGGVDTEVWWFVGSDLCKSVFPPACLARIIIGANKGD
jgi:uncharacterized protein YodC (DUF2158 family)